MRRLQYLNLTQVRFWTIVVLWGFCAVLLFAFLQPNGVDWKYYATVEPAYDEIYFGREFLSWFLIDFLSDFDASGILMASTISTLLFSATFRLSHTLNGRLHIAVLTALLLTFSNFYLLMSVNGLRQGLSVFFLLFAIERYWAGKSFWVVLFIASVFCHNSAAIFAPLLLLRTIRPSLHVAGGLCLIGIGDVLTGIAGKNDNVSVTQNSEVFLALTVIIFMFVIFHIARLNIFKLRSAGATNVALSVFYLLCTSLAFYGSSSAFERLVYSTLPLMIVFSSYFFDVYRPRSLFASIYLVIIFVSSDYALNHPSVTNNFLNL